MISRASVLVDAILHAQDALARLEQRRAPWLDPPLSLELALALGDNHLEPREVGRERFVERAPHLGDAVAVDLAQPLHPDAFQRALDGLVAVYHALLLVLEALLDLLVRCRKDVLRAGRRGVAVFHDQQHRIAAVE